ncbi:hypothetical protein AB1L07_02420 [Niallia alba]|uniref:hypothetical protein n=1 Tax=Niallia alba TaxID=2729105 RepID=UPI0039A0FE48
MLVKEKLRKTIMSLQRTLENLEKGDKLAAKCDLDHARDYIDEGFWLLYDEIRDKIK